MDRRLILAGKTIAEGENGYGVVIFKAEDLKTAKEIMENDPAVNQGLMNAELQEFRIAIINEKNRD